VAHRLYSAVLRLRATLCHCTSSSLASNVSHPCSLVPKGIGTYCSCELCDCVRLATTRLLRGSGSARREIPSGEEARDKHADEPYSPLERVGNVTGEEVRSDDSMPEPFAATKTWHANLFETPPLPPQPCVRERATHQSSQGFHSFFVGTADQIFS
jgi:hypothetical protein